MPDNSPPPVRVLHLVGSASAGGVESFVLGLVRDADPSRLGIDVCVVGPDGPVAEEIRAAGGRVFILDARNGFDPISLMRFWWLVRRRRYHILHANVGGRLLRRAARAAGCRIIVTHVHGVPDDLVPHFRNTGSTHPVLRELCEGSEVVIACSEFVARVLRKSGPPPTPLVTIPCGVDILSHRGSGHHDAGDLRRLLSIPAASPLIGFVGRLVPQKGLRHLLAAGQRVLREHPDAHFIVVGDGPLRGEMVSLASQVAPGQIHFLGERRDVPALMPQFSMLVTPSEWEAFGLVNVEAMAAGRPVVAFDVDGISEAVVDGETGILVRHGDIEALADAILSLIDAPHRAEKMGIAGRQRVEEYFDSRRVAASLEELYANFATSGQLRADGTGGTAPFGEKSQGFARASGSGG